MQDGWKAVWSIPSVSVAFFPSLKQNFIAYRSFKVSDCIFEIHQLWQSGFCRVYSNCCCRCLFEAEIIKIGQSSHKKYSNNILNFQESTTILNTCTKKVWKLIECTTYSRCVSVCVHPENIEASRKLLSFYRLWSYGNFIEIRKFNLSCRLKNNITLRCSNFATRFTLLSSKISFLFQCTINCKYLTDERNKEKRKSSVNWGFTRTVGYNLKKLDLLGCYSVTQV